MISDLAEQAVAGGTLDERHKLEIVAEDALEERLPDRRGRSGRRGRD